MIGVIFPDQLHDAVSWPDDLSAIRDSLEPSRRRRGACGAPGTHLTAMGADTVGKQELPVALLERAQVTVRDDVATALNAGELQHATPELHSRVRACPELASAGPLTRREDAIAAAALRGINLP